MGSSCSAMGAVPRVCDAVEALAGEKHLLRGVEGAYGDRCGSGREDLFGGVGVDPEIPLGGGRGVARVIESPAHDGDVAQLRVMVRVEAAERGEVGHGAGDDEVEVVGAAVDRVDP